MNGLIKLLKHIFGIGEQKSLTRKYKRSTSVVPKPVNKSIPISSPFGPRVDPISGKKRSFHYGIDFACPEGTPVFAMFSGKVFKVGWQDKKNKKKGFGKRVWIKSTIDNNKYDHFYAHLSHLFVKKGQQIRAYQLIGKSGNTGKSTGPHLHVQLRPSDLSKKGVPIKFKGE